MQKYTFKLDNQIRKAAQKARSAHITWRMIEYYIQLKLALWPYESKAYICTKFN